MKTVMINRNSWHFWLAQVWGKFAGHWRVAEDFCQYVRWVVGGLLVAIVLGVAACAVVGAVMWSAGDFLGWLVAGIIHGFVEPWVAAAFLGVLAAIAVVCGYMACRVAAPIVAEHQPAFLRDAYTSIKDRVCYRVEVR